MKANFALTLSVTGIRLLHRAAGGWRFVGEVALGDPDLERTLASLRRTALEVEPSGLRTKLVLPGTQVRYLTIDTANMGDEGLRAAAAAALDGTTPYPVSELVFDLSPDGDQTHVAAVARETLAEAEAFAIEHRFAPISFVGRPDGEAFLGEPHFGPTEYARHILGPGQSVEPDGVAVVELGPIEWPDGPVVDVAEDTPVAGDEPPRSAGPMPLVSSWGARPDASGTDAATDAPGDAANDPDMDGSATDDAPAPSEMPTEVSSDAPAPVPPRRSVGFASRRKPGANAAPKLGGVTRRFDPVAATAAETAGPPPDPATQAKPVPAPESAPADDDVPDPPPAVLAAFLSRRHASAVEHDPRTSKADTRNPAPAPLAAPAPVAGPTPAPRPAKAAEPSEILGVPSMAYAADRTRPEIRPLRVPRPQSERQRMTVFGARQTESDGAAVIGGKPRFLGLVLTAMLLIFLAGVAAWAAVFIDEGIARFFAPRTPEAPITAEELAPEPEPASLPPATMESAATPDATEEREGLPEEVAQPEIPPEDDLETASLEPELPPEEAVEAEPEVLAEPEQPKVFDPVEAEAQYAVTGIWIVPPDVPQAPGLVEVDDLYVTSIDPPGESFDAVALLPGTSFRADHAPLAPGNPAPPGTEFDFDDRGMVIPTPDGAMSPDGIVVYSGLPPVVPPGTPKRDEEVPEDIDAAARQELSGFRPRVRPDDLVENTERRQLGGLSRSELADYRPRVRPETVKQAQEKDETPTAQAVASSMRPSNRPGNFAQVVARAVEKNLSAATSDDNAEPQEVAAVAPRTVAPSIPSRSSVTQEATVRNAVNLKRINLMGVYGSPANRRALVRLSNGSYKKVKVGDRIDGGRVSAIGDSELSYVKGNRNIVLKMPRT